MKRPSDVLVSYWNCAIDRVTELEAVVQNLEATLNEQEEEANTAIGVWQQSYTAMEQKKTELAEEIESSREQSDKLRQEAVSALQQKLEQTEAALIEAQKRFSDADASATQLQGKTTIPQRCTSLDWSLTILAPKNKFLCWKMPKTTC